MLLLARLGALLLVRDGEANPLEEGVEDGLPLGAGSPPPPILGHLFHFLVRPPLFQEPSPP